MTITPGMVIDGKYSIVRLIGEGGMGAVYEGVNQLIRRRVAIKVLHAGTKDSAGVVERFEREAQAAGCIGSDHILEVLDLGSLPNGDRYMVMEFLDGESLADRIRGLGRMSPQDITPLLRQALVGLDAAHRAGIVHRDLKPDNIYILKEKAGRPNFVKIIDFGISKFNSLSGDMSMTRTGAVMGTPYYMSPEQAKGAGSVTAQTDLYSMGVIAFEALTGRVPFDGQTFNDLMFKIVLSEMPDLEEIVPGIDAGFAAIVRKAMHKDMSQRFQDCEEFIAALDRWSPMARTAVDGTRSSVHDEAIPPTVPMASAQAGSSSHLGTNLDWAASQHGADVIPKKAVPTAAYIGAAAVVLLGAAAVLAMKFGGSDAKEEALSPAVAAQPEPKAKEPEPPPPAPATAAPAAAPAPKPEEAAVPSAKPSGTSASAKKPATARPASTPRPATAKPATTRPSGGKFDRDFGY